MIVSIIARNTNETAVDTVSIVNIVVIWVMIVFLLQSIICSFLNEFTDPGLLLIFPQMLLIVGLMLLLIDIHKILTIIPFLKLVYLTFYLKIKKKQAKYSLASLIIRNSNTLCISLTKIINQVYFDYFVLFSHSLSFSVISWLQARNMEKVIL